MSKFKAMVLFCSFFTLFMCNLCEAGFMYHATSKAVARRIMAKGINPAKFKGNARYWRQMYVTKRPTTALAEKGSHSSLIRMRSSKYLDRNSWDLRNPNTLKLRRYLGNTDLRGKFKQRIIGPKLGQKLGKIASQKGKAIKYRSVRTGGTNIAVPKSMLREHPRALSHPELIRNLH